MKSVFTYFILVILSVTTVFSQTPDKISYQAVVRNGSNFLVINSQVGVRISVLQGSAQGNPVYVETQTPFTNSNGLFSIEIGGGQAVFGNFSSINWASGSYFIRNEIDIAGGTNYSITGTSQLLSVPYALHAKTADILNESDPSFNASVASNINASDVSNWNNKQNQLTAGTGISISGSTISATGAGGVETDPVFSGSAASGISSTSITNWNNKQDHLTAGSGINISGNTISATGIGGTEADPIFTASPAGNITNADKTAWNNKQNQLTAGSGITISGNTISASGSGGGLFTHYIGELFGGGIVVAVWRSNGVEHGLIASLTDLSSTSKWSNINTAVGVNAQSVSNGQTNTAAITQQTGHTESAALLCTSYNAGGFNDWYLPTYFELNLCHSVAAVINSVLGDANGFKGNTYWSSVESAANKAFRFSFVTGSCVSTAKSTTANSFVRAVRKF